MNQLCIWINLIIFVNCELKIEDIIMPDYQLEDGTLENVKSKFTINRRNNRIKNSRIILLDQYSSNETIYLDGIAHDKIDTQNGDIERIKTIEMEFRNIIGMYGVKTIFKRDTVWRTWRQVKGVSDNDIVCYKCQNVAKVNCSNCQVGNYWIIEDKPPPCPYELFSLQNDEEICVSNYKQYANIESACSTIIEFSDLFVNCNNPIETKYIIQRDYKAVSKRYPNVICKGRENCVISTQYIINNKEIIFRIMNAANNIIYSRIMRSNNNNYACFKDCGYLNPNNKKVYPNDKSLILNLLDGSRLKKKRENLHIKDKNKLKMEKANRNKYNTTATNKNKIHILQYAYDRIETNKRRQQFNKTKKGKVGITSIEVKTLSSCKRLEKHEKEDDNETSDYE